MRSFAPRADFLRSLPLLSFALLLLGGATAAISYTPPPARPGVDAAPLRLPPAYAVPVRMDTLFLGGYAEGSFSQALVTLASDLSPAERTLIGRHLDKIFAGMLEVNGLGQRGRLRVAYERVVRPDGSTRSIRVLAAEAAVAGRVHTAIFYDRDGRPGYFDPLGRSLDPEVWASPLPEPEVTSPFGLQRLHPILKRVLPHTGTDYAAAHGTPVQASADGSVSHAGPRGGYGILVEVQHPNGYSTRYAHLSAAALRPGDAVRQGDVVGYSGATGLATGPHLHYEVRRHNQPLDPEQVGARFALAADVSYDARWSRERRALGRLLSRAPTTLAVRPAAAAR